MQVSLADMQSPVWRMHWVLHSASVSKQRRESHGVHQSRESVANGTTGKTYSTGRRFHQIFQNKWGVGYLHDTKIILFTKNIFLPQHCYLNSKIPLHIKNIKLFSKMCFISSPGNTCIVQKNVSICLSIKK